MPGGGLTKALAAGVGMVVGAGLLEVLGFKLGAVVGLAVKISAPGGVFATAVPVGAGEEALLLPLVAVVPQPQAAKKSSSVIISKAPFPSTSPVELMWQCRIPTLLFRGQSSII